MSLDGYCDHTGMIADDELHEHYNEMLRHAGALIYGRITYQLMESYWPTIVKTPTGNQQTDDFAVLIDNIPKIVFSRTLQQVDWKNTTLKNELIKEEMIALKQSGDGGSKDIYIGSPGLIVAFMQLDLIDEYQLCVHPVIVGKGLPLFKNINDRKILKLIKSKTLGGGQIVHYYEPAKNGG